MDGRTPIPSSIKAGLLRQAEKAQMADHETEKAIGPPRNPGRANNLQ
jgi:hypothetical protein